MKEQFGGIYWQLPANVSTPINNTYVRLFRDLTAGPNFGLYFIKKFDGTIEPFDISIDNGIGDFANIGWNLSNANMIVTATPQIITGAAVTRQTFEGTSFVQANPNELSIKYVGPSGATIRLEMVDTHSTAQNGFLTFDIFRNGVSITDSNFQANQAVTRTVGQAMTIVKNVQQNDIFDVRAITSNNPSTLTFRDLSFIATKQK